MPTKQPAVPFGAARFQAPQAEELVDFLQQFSFPASTSCGQQSAPPPPPGAAARASRTPPEFDIEQQARCGTVWRVESERSACRSRLGGGA
eukprot:547994-Alexandrium_andersonii.AAC.1